MEEPQPTSDAVNDTPLLSQDLSTWDPDILRTNEIETVYQTFRGEKEDLDNLVLLFLNKILVPLSKYETSNNDLFNQWKIVPETVLFSNNLQFLHHTLVKTIQAVYHCTSIDSISKEEGEKCLEFMLETSHRLRNVQKFILHFLKATKKCPSQFSLSTSFRNKLEECFRKIPINQNLSLWVNLWKVIHEEMLSSEASLAGPTPRLSLASELLSLSLLNVKLADYSIQLEVIGHVVDSFITFDSEFQLLTKKILECPQVFGAPFLRIAVAYGDLHQLLLLYSPNYREQRSLTVKEPPEEAVNDTVWDLTYFHGYACAEEWQKIMEMTLENNVTLWGELVLQKFRAIVLFYEEKVVDVRKFVEKLTDFLIENYDCCEQLWLNNVNYLLPYLNTNQLVVMSEKIASNRIWKQALTEACLEDKSLQMALVQALLKRISDRSRKRKADNFSGLLNISGKKIFKILTQNPIVWVQNMKESVLEVANWLNESAEVIRVAIKDSTESKVATEDSSSSEKADNIILDVLDFMSILPMEYATGSLHSLILQTCFGLLIGLETTTDELNDKMWMSIVRLLDNSEKMSSLCDYFPSNQLLDWILICTKRSPNCLLIFSTIFNEALRSMKGLTDIVDWVKSTNFNGDFPLLVMVFEKFSSIALNVSNNTTKKGIILDLFHNLRKKYLKHFMDNLSASPELVLKGAMCLLKVYMDRRKKKTSLQPSADHSNEKQIKVKPLTQNLTKVIDISRIGLMTEDEVFSSVCADFLHFLFSHHQFVVKYIPTNVKLDIWNAYRETKHHQRWEDPLLRDIVSSTSERELYILVNQMLEDLQLLSWKINQQRGAKPLDDTDAGTLAEYKRVLCFIHHLVIADIRNIRRYTIRSSAVQSIFPILQHIAVSQCRRAVVRDVIRFVLPIMEIYLSVLKMEKSYCYPHDLASCLHVCLIVPLDGVADHEPFQQLFTVVYKAIHYLITVHEEISADRIPVLLQIFRCLLSAVARQADQKRKITDSEIADLVDCANRLARLSSIINKQKLRYRRVITYIVADIIQELQKRTLYPSVKRELLNVLHHFMDMIDQHAAKYLLSVLAPGTRELFRHEYQQFQKFQKFTGKI